MNFTAPRRPKQSLTPLRRPAAGRRAGFTLVEIMIVVLIIAMLLNIAAPSFIRARDLGQARACITNLHNIELAKEQYAIQNNKATSYTPTWANLTPYIKQSAQPICPTNSQTYTFNNLGLLPTCSYNAPTGLPQHIAN